MSLQTRVCLIFATLMAIIGYIVTAQSEDNMTNANWICDYTTVGATLFVPDTLTIADISICCTNGKVTIPEGVSLDEATRAFWLALEKVYPEMFKDKVLSDEQRESTKEGK